MGFHPDVPNCHLPRWRPEEQRAQDQATRKMYAARDAASDARGKVRGARRRLAEALLAESRLKAESDASYAAMCVVIKACTAAQFPPGPRKGCDCAECVAGRAA